MLACWHARDGGMFYAVQEASNGEKRDSVGSLVGLLRMSERQTRFCVLEPLRHEDDTGMMLFALCFAMLCDVYETGSICQQFSGVRQCRCEYVVCGAVPTLFQRRVKHVSES